MAENKRDLFTRYYLEYYPMVANAISIRIGDRDEAEDLCQEVFLTLYNKLEEVEDVRRWLYGTLKNKVLHHYRDRLRKECVLEDLFPDVAMAFVNGFRDTRILIMDVFNAVIGDEADRVLFDMIAVANYSYAEAARLLDTTKRKVEYRYLSIVRRIVDEFRRRGIPGLEELL